MLIPQFTLRRLLAITALAAVVSLIVSYALRGQTWALGVSIGVFAVIVAMLVYGAAFWLVWLYARLTARRRS